MSKTSRLRWLLLSGAALLPAQVETGRDYGRSMVVARQGIVATSQVSASQAGAEILRRGGSAVDAAIAANAVLGLVEPMMDGIGGDLFVLYWDAKTGKLTGLNSSGPAPKGLTPQFLASAGISKMPGAGIHSVTLPGAVAGWEALHQRFGKLAWKPLFDFAIGYAQAGFPVSEAIHESWTTDAVRAASQPESRKLFLPGGQPPATGDLFRNPDLARAYRLIAAHGAKTFYRGEIASAILKTSQRMGGTMTSQDLESFTPEWVTPVSTSYRGWQIFELPPNGQGMAALEMLNIMETKPAVAGGPMNADEIHMRIEAMKLAYSDLYRYDADPRTNAVPVEQIISKAYALKRAALIDSAQAHCEVPAGQPVSGDTTYLTVVDREGDIASWIQSISAGFGSGITVDGMGFLLHNRGAGFTLDPQSPNVLAGGKRPFHTIIPAFMQQGDLHIGFGIMGGANQPLAHAQFASNIIDFGMNVQAALEAPRFTKREATGCEVKIEGRVPSAVTEQLEARGHRIDRLRSYNQLMGRGQAILHNSATGINYGASDPRADGAAIPEPFIQ